MLQRSQKPLHHPTISLQPHMCTYQRMHLNSNVKFLDDISSETVFISFKNKNLKIISEKMCLYYVKEI